MKSLKALVVDDDEQILARMKDRVLDLGHECDAVGSVYEAEGLVQDNQYDYVVLDMELPLRYGDLPSPSVGNQFLNGLRSRFKTLPIFVVLLLISGSPSPRRVPFLWRPPLRNMWLIRSTNKRHPGNGSHAKITDQLSNGSP